MQNSILKSWDLKTLHILKQFHTLQSSDKVMEGGTLLQKYLQKPILKLPLQFTYPAVQIISKQLTKLNSKYKERIIYLGPRWTDSVIWHKKFSKSNHQFSQQNQKIHQNNGYYFNQRRVLRNNNFIHDSMKQNRFFKNQIYYRAFQGMNPTLNQGQQIIFESRFQSGNLDCVVKVSQNQYDLFLRIDSNTRGHIFWYYFKLWLPKGSNVQNKKIRLNICNISKSKTLYQKNLKPYIKRTPESTKKKSKSNKNYDSWSQGQGIDYCIFRQKRLRYKFVYEKIKYQKMYELSFQLELKANQQVSLAYSIPYTYSDLLVELKSLQQQIIKEDIKNVYINKLEQSLTGVQIPIVTIGKLENYENQDERKVIIITGRIHPGQSNSSLIVSSLLKQYILKKTEKVIERQTIIIIIPMLNPDGVIIGNGRCSALGRDLNRQFKSWNNYLNPEVVSVKKLIDKIQQTHQIQLYFDFHGHSKKKNVFFFGPNYNVTQPNYYRCRIFPKMLSKNLQFFRYFGCSYTIQQNKRTTARAIMLNQFNIPFFYTVQTSIGFYHDYNKRQDVCMERQVLFKIGLKFKQTLKEYFQGIQEYQEYIKSKKSSKNGQKQAGQNESDFQLGNQNGEQKVFQLKYIKVFDQIKTQSKLQEKNKNVQQSSQSDSDSCRKSQYLQNQKSKQFADMLINFNKIQQHKTKNIKSNTNKLHNQAQQKLTHQKKQKKKHHSQVNDQIINLIKKLSIKHQSTKCQFRIHSNTAPVKNQYPAEDKRYKSKQIYLNSNQMIDELKKRQLISAEIERAKLSSLNKSNQMNVSVHNFYKKNQLQLNFKQNQQIGIVNLSKMIQNPRSLRYSEQNNTPRLKSRSQRRKINNKNHQNENIKNHIKNDSNFVKNFQMFPQQKGTNLQQFDSNNLIQNNNFLTKPYPSSFYRIKYQSSHKKYRQSSMDRTFYNFQKNFQEGKLTEMQTENNKSKKVKNQDQSLFISINKIQN